MTRRLLVWLLTGTLLVAGALLIPGSPVYLLPELELLWTTSSSGKSPEEVKTAKPKEPELPPEEREYIWEIEHHGNLLVKYGFSPLAAAIQKADKAALTQILAEDFIGTDLGKPLKVEMVAGHVQ